MRLPEKDISGHPTVAKSDIKYIIRSENESMYKASMHFIERR